MCRWKSIPGDFVGSEDFFAPVEGLLCELLYVGLSGGIVRDGVIVCVFRFQLCLSAQSLVSRVSMFCATFSNLSIRSVV